MVQQGVQHRHTHTQTHTQTHTASVSPVSASELVLLWFMGFLAPASSQSRSKAGNCFFESGAEENGALGS
jgi:hypothetical protein